MPAKKGTKTVFEKWASKCEKNNQVDATLFDKLDVKRGLRNKDGSGVLAGLTQVSSVVGFIKNEQGMQPVEGVLQYRGIDIRDLVKGLQQEKRFGFEECAYLLLFGELPTRQELAEFTAEFRQREALPAAFVRDVVLPYQSANIMTNLSRGVLALYSLDERGDAIDIPTLVRQAIDIVAKFPILTVYAYHSMRYQLHGETLLIRQPRPDYSTAENFLYLMRPDGNFTSLEAHVLDILLVMHTDHGGGNNSTFSTRVVSSSATDSYSAMAAAVGSLKGPLHGGANISVMNMMEDIQKHVKNWKNAAEIKRYLVKIFKCKAGDGSGKIYGFGHAVYTKSDPRAVLIKQFARQLAAQKKRQKELDLYFLMEKLVPQAFLDYKGISKIISPNVDFYSGFVYDCLQIPKEVYTPLFAVARVAGWMAHRIEELMVSKRIIRPGYKSVAPKREYQRLANRRK